MLPTLTVPNSVKFTKVGVVLPSLIGFELPDKSISGEVLLTVKAQVPVLPEASVAPRVTVIAPTPVWLGPLAGVWATVGDTVQLSDTPVAKEV